MFKLSICIATYNRAKFIGNTLESIIPQLTDEVEILIVDGASTDNTKEVINNYAQRCNNIRYIRLPNKGGVDQDYNISVEMSHGEFCWLFTDDDLLKDDAIDKVLHEISKGCSLVVVNSEVWNKDFSIILSDRLLPNTIQTTFSPASFDLFYTSCADYLSFIGSVVIKKNIWQERNKESYFGTEFIHVGVIFQKLIPSDIIIVSEPMIKIRYLNAQWTSRRFEIGAIKWPKLLWSFETVSIGAKKNVMSIEPWRSLRALLVYRGLSAFNNLSLSKLKTEFELPFFWYISAKIISIIPVSFMNIVLIKYFTYVGKTKDLKYHDLLDVKSKI